MQIISALAWPVVALVAIGALLTIVWWLHDAIVQAMSERPLTLAVGIGKMRAIAETRERDKIDQAVAALNTPGGETVSANKLAIRDSEGNVRVLLTVMNDGAVLLGMFGEDRQPGALLVVEKDGKPGLEFYDGNTIRAQLRLVKEGDEAMIFYDANERVRAILGLDAEGKSVVGLWDQNGTAAWGSRA